MYSRRLKLNKKKPKPTKAKQTPGSVWGPRLALIERQRQLAEGGILDDEEEELYELHHELVPSVKKPLKQRQSHPQPNVQQGGRQQQHQSEVDPVLRLGRSSSPNYFYYNYSRRTAPNAQTRKISCPEPSVNKSSHYESRQQLQKHLPPGNQHQRRASYVLGSSSGYCSGSVTTLSNCGGNGSSFEQFTKPLTLIIPPQERYDLRRGQGGRNYGRIRECEEFGGDVQSQDSFPSSSAYQSSGEEGDLEGRREGRRVKRQFHNPMANMKPMTSGILQISTKEVVQIHAPPESSPPLTVDDLGNGTEPETLEIGAEETAQKDGNAGGSTGSQITALAQGVTMVYVPMEASSSRRGEDGKQREGGRNGNSSNTDCDSSGDDLLPEYNEPADLPELGQQSDDGSASSRSSRGIGNKEPEDSLSSNFILKRKVAPALHGGGDSSLLDSFDSILFKPRPGEALHKSQERCQTEQKGIRKRPEQPPPLPPSNATGVGGKHMEKKNLRFALDNLETVLNPSKSSSSGEHSISPPPPPPQQHLMPQAPKKMLKKVTLSLPGEDNATLNRNHELLLNYEELNNCSSEILSCGHVRSDDYSTLSSLTSSAQEISDLDEIGSNQGNNSGGDNGDGGSNSGGGESDVSTGNNQKTNHHEPRSVIQQLHDLSRLIRGSSPTKLFKLRGSSKENSSGAPQPPVHFTESNSFFLHQVNNSSRQSPAAPPSKQSDSSGSGAAVVNDTKRKTSDATDNSADSGKGSGSGTGSSGQEGSSSSAEPSPNNTRLGGVTISNGSGGGVSVKIQNNRRLKVATIRGRGGGTGSHHHYTVCSDDHCEAADSCSQKSGCSCPDCYDYHPDCSECVLYNNPNSGFPKPSNSQVLCSNEAGGGGVQRPKKESRTSSGPPPPPQKSVSRPVSRIVRRTSSRVRPRRTASLKRSKVSAGSHGSTNRKPVILDYCDCKNCDLADCDFDDVDDEERSDCCRDKSCRPHPPPARHHEPLIIPVTRGSKCKVRAGPKVDQPPGRKISSSSGSSGVSSSSSAGKISRISAFRSSASVTQQQTQQAQQQTSQLLRQSDAAATGLSVSNTASSVVVPLQVPSSNNLFTIDEANEESVYGESAPVVIGKGGRSTASKRSNTPPQPDFQHHSHSDDSIETGNAHGAPSKRNSRSQSEHSHPKCWLAPDATLGWSDLESLYSQNMKIDGRPKPSALRDECPTCWKELSEMKKNCSDPNRTVDRTKRMFIWLNRRPKEFHAPWWEAKKQASMRWLLTKAFAHLPKDKVPDPFKESKKGKPTKYSLRDEIVKGLVSGRLYCMALDSLYRSQQNNYHLSQNLTHWEIIKILSRRGIYIAQPSDMKLTEATLRQKKPIRTAAHIALIEAMMGLYAKEILGRDRIAQTLRSFGKAIDPDTNSPERLVITWINTAVTSLKSYILSNAPQHLSTNKANRWLNLPEVGEIRDLCDGVGICALFALYCSNDLKVEEISVPEAGDTLTIYDQITNHSLVQKLCEDLFPEPIYHLCVTDFLYIHGCMKQNILCFLVDLFVHLEINPILRVNRLTHVPIRVEL